MRPDHVLLAGVAAVALAAVGAAVYTQYAWDMQPCPWCVLQRAVFVAMALVALAGLPWRTPGGRRLAAAGVVLLALAGSAAALWQHYVAAASANCKLTLADRIMSTLGLDSAWPDVFAARASCADAAAKLLGVPYEFWSLALFGALGLAGLGVLRRP